MPNIELSKAAKADPGLLASLQPLLDQVARDHADRPDLVRVFSDALTITLETTVRRSLPTARRSWSPATSPRCGCATPPHRSRPTFGLPSRTTTSGHGPGRRVQAPGRLPGHRPLRQRLQRGTGRRAPRGLTRPARARGSGNASRSSTRCAIRSGSRRLWSDAGTTSLHSDERCTHAHHDRGDDAHRAASRNSSAYSFLRETPCPATHSPAKAGCPHRATGMVRSGFRPSDDACDYGFLVPANMFAVVVSIDFAEFLQQSSVTDAAAEAQPPGERSATASRDTPSSTIPSTAGSTPTRWTVSATTASATTPTSRACCRPRTSATARRRSDVPRHPRVRAEPRQPLLLRRRKAEGSAARTPQGLDLADRPDHAGPDHHDDDEV